MDVAIIGPAIASVTSLIIVVYRIGTRRSPREWVALAVCTVIALALVYFGKLVGSETMWWVGLYTVVFATIAAAWVAAAEALDDSAPRSLPRFRSPSSRVPVPKTLPRKWVMASEAELESEIHQAVEQLAHLEREARSRRHAIKLLSNHLLERCPHRGVSYSPTR